VCLPARGCVCAATNTNLKTEAERRLAGDLVCRGDEPMENSGHWLRGFIGGSMSCGAIARHQTKSWRLMRFAKLRHG